MPRSRLSVRDQAAIDRLLDRFVPAAIARKHPLAAYDLVTPGLRGRLTRREWATGSIPVPPFPARGGRFHGWTITYVDGPRVGLDLLLYAQNPRSAVRQIAYAIEVQRSGRGWLVSSAIPAALYGASTITTAKDYGPGAASPASRSRLDPLWIVVPLGVLGAILLVPLAFVAVSWSRGRRDRRALGGRRELPPLPPSLEKRLSSRREPT